MSRILGRRVEPDSDGNLILSEGDYGMDTEGVIRVRPPRCPEKTLPNHSMIGHSDGTASITPMIYAGSWNGFLERGIWRTVE